MGISIHSAVSTVNFDPTVRIKNWSSNNDKSLARSRSKESVKPKEELSITKCGICSNTKLQIVSPTFQNCDRRLKTCLKFMEMNVNDHLWRDHKDIKGHTYKYLKKIRDHKYVHRFVKRESTGGLLFEIRVIAQGGTDQAGNAPTKWTSNYMAPRWWNPTAKFAHYGGPRQRLCWYLYGPFEIYEGHSCCPMEERENCNTGCRTIENRKNYTLIKDIETMVFRKTCKCKGFSTEASKKESENDTIKWHVHLYESITEVSAREWGKQKEEKDLNSLIGNIGITGQEGGSNEDNLPTITEESGTAIPETT